MFHNSLLNIFAHFVGFNEFLVSFDFTRGFHSAAKGGSRKTGFRIAGYPAGKTLYGTVGGMFFGVGGSG